MSHDRTPPSPRILIVEDVPVLAEVASAHLRADGCETLLAPNGAAGLAAAAAFRPDLVLLDMMMPVVDGIEFLRRAKSVDALRGVPILMLSAVSERDKVTQCLLLGALDYVLKPVDPAILLRKVRRHAKPRGPADDASAAPAPSAVEPPPRGERPVALVAAASADVVDAVRAALAENFSVHVASDGATALDAAAKSPPSLVVAEARLSVFDGVEVIARLRAIPESAGAACALVAVRAEFDAVRRAKEIANVEVLARPVDPAAVAKFAAAALAKATKEKSKASGSPRDEAHFDPSQLDALRSLPAAPGEPSVVDQIVDGYFADAPKRIAALKTAIETSDAPAVAAAAHALRGGSGSVGATSVAALCLEMETAAKKGPPVPPASAIARLEEALGHYRDAVGRWRQAT